MPKQLLLEFTDYEKDFNEKKNAELSRHDGFATSPQNVAESSDYIVSLRCIEYFASARVAYYGDDWLQLLFQTLFVNRG